MPRVVGAATVTTLAGQVNIAGIVMNEGPVVTVYARVGLFTLGADGLASGCDSVAGEDARS